MIAGEVAVLKMARVPLDPPQLTSFVTSQMAICGLSVAMSASKVPLTVGCATIGGRKKKPDVPPSWTASLIIASGPISLAASRRSAQLAARTTIPLSMAMRRIISPPKVPPVGRKGAVMAANSARCRCA